MVTATWDPPDEPNGKIRGEAYNALLFLIEQFISGLVCEEYSQVSERAGDENLYQYFAKLQMKINHIFWFYMLH